MIIRLAALPTGSVFRDAATAKSDRAHWVADPNAPGRQSSVDHQKKGAAQCWL